MQASVRMICRSCSRTVELSSDQLSSVPVLCPFCGGTIDSRLSDQGTTHETTDLLHHCFQLDAASPWDETGRKEIPGSLGRYQIRQLLGSGAFGQVYQAYDPRLDRDVALKVLKQHHTGERVFQRFLREARAAARLNHPLIAAIHDAGQEAGRCWIAYEYVPGRPLARLLDQQRMDRTSAVRVVRDLADALDHAHGQEISHRYYPSRRPLSRAA